MITLNGNLTVEVVKDILNKLPKSRIKTIEIVPTKYDNQVVKTTRWKKQRYVIINNTWNNILEKRMIDNYISDLNNDFKCDIERGDYQHIEEGNKIKRLPYVSIRIRNLEYGEIQQYFKSSINLNIWSENGCVEKDFKELKEFILSMNFPKESKTFYRFTSI